MATPSSADGDTKFRELVLYLAAKSESDPAYGATKLNKLLFFCDFLSYRTMGRSITGSRYQKLDFGPAPKRLLPVQQEMLEAGDCAIQRRDYFGRKQQRLLALRDPDLSCFSGEEVALIDRVVEELRGNSASEVSQLSHRFIGWQAAAMGEDIPYETVFVGSPRALTEAEIRYGQELARERGETP